MRARGAVIQGALALGALALAYATWQRRIVPDDEDVVVLDSTRVQLSRVRYEDGPRWVELEWRKEGGEVVPWVHYGQHPSVSPGAPDAGTRSTPAPPAVQSRELKGNETAENVLEKFAPLRAVRNLGALSSDKRKELGLDNSPRHLEVVVRNVPYRFIVSSGSLGTPYLLDVRNGNVFLEQGQLLMDLDAASARLVEKRLHTFKASEMDEAVIDADGHRRAFSVVASQFGPWSQVADKATPGKQDGFAKNWLEKSWRVFPVEVLGKHETPSTGAPKVQVRVEYLSKGKPLGFVELARSGSDTYVRSENLPGWAKVYNVDELVRDAPRLTRP